LVLWERVMEEFLGKAAEAEKLGRRYVAAVWFAAAELAAGEGDVTSPDLDTALEFARVKDDARLASRPLGRMWRTKEHVNLCPQCSHFFAVTGEWDNMHSCGPSCPRRGDEGVYVCEHGGCP
jgi:hypothetical protein